MAKYRLLTTKELAELEPEFIKYLVVNGITADDWKRLKQNKPDEAQHIVDLFSDVVFEKILRKAAFLQLQNEKILRVIKCGAVEMELIAVHAIAGDQETDEIFKGTKKYIKSREEEIFALLEEGYAICDGTKFLALSEVLKTKSSQN